MRFVLILMVFTACSNQTNKSKLTIIKGKTMGSTYEIAYDTSIDLTTAIDYRLGFFSYLVSTYNDSSILSKFNHNQPLTATDSVSYQKSIRIFKLLDSFSRKVNTASFGAFNPGITDLINYWGFGEKRKNPENADTALVMQLKQVDASFLVQFKGLQPLKSNPGQKLNFNAIAPGLAADLIAEMFDSVYHIKNYYVNISGEIRVKGNNTVDSYWPIKIEKPMFAGLKPIEYCTVPLKNYSLATSGNYRQFFVSKGKKYGHSIDPRTGFPARNKMLSATILAPTATEADAYATACMVLGLNDAQKMINANPHLKAFLIYDENGKMTHWATANLSYTMAESK
ncbi:MAG TPA: FAD:protein FMN transferase [Bacteroidia bacterium]